MVATTTMTIIVVLLLLPEKVQSIIEIRDRLWVVYQVVYGHWWGTPLCFMNIFNVTVKLYIYRLQIFKVS